MGDIPLIYDDPRPISAIWFPGDDAPGYWTASKDSMFRCDKILAYKEHGPGDFMPFFAVYRDGEIHARIPAWQVTVQYKDSSNG
jgi:hypothetical protein